MNTEGPESPLEQVEEIQPCQFKQDDSCTILKCDGSQAQTSEYCLTKETIRRQLADSAGSPQCKDELQRTSSVRQTKSLGTTVNKTNWQDGYSAKVDAEGVDLKNSKHHCSLGSIRIFDGAPAPSLSNHQRTKNGHFIMSLTGGGYVAQPEGLVDPDHPEKDYLLRKLSMD
ncbi:hypothetical protein Tco_1391236 [Tanacetum coccineum]